MDAATLAPLVHENVVACLTEVGRQVAGADVERVDGVAIAATGLPLRLFNQVLVDGNARSDAIARAVALMRGREAQFVVNLRRGSDEVRLPLMAELGLVAISDDPWIPGMAMSPLPQPGTATVPGHEIRRVTDGAGVRDHITTAASGFGMPVEWLEAIVTDRLFDAPGAALYVGYVDGEPVTTGFGFRTWRTIGVYNIATVEAARRRGYGAAMTMRVVDDGAAAGCDVAILQSSDMGFPIYERLGFRTVVEYCGYVDPASTK